MPKEENAKEEMVSIKVLAMAAGRKVEEIRSYSDSGLIRSVILEKGTAWAMERFPLKECLKRIKGTEKAAKPTEKTKKT